MPNTKTQSKENQKLLGDWVKEWKNILPQISTWLKLLALIVLVAATFIIVAMTITPSANPYYSIYPVALLFLLLVIIIGIFIDRHYERVAETRPEVNITENNSLKIEQKPVAANDTANIQNFSDSRIGFKAYSSTKSGWKKPQFLSYKQLMMNVGIIENDDDGNALIKAILLAHPYGEMYSKSDNVVFQYGDNIKIDFLDKSSTQAIEEYLAKVQKYLKETENQELTNDETEEVRKKLFIGDSNISKLVFQVGLTVQVLEKKFAISSVAKPTLPNIFKSVIVATQEPIEQLSASENFILVITKVKLLDVNINGHEGDLTIYRTYKLLDSDDKIFILQIQWSPESDSAIEVWDELKKMIDSFTIIQ